MSFNANSPEIRVERRGALVGRVLWRDPGDPTVADLDLTPYHVYEISRVVEASGLPKVCITLYGRLVEVDEE